MTDTRYKILQRFLKQSIERQEPEAMCLSGPWGVGKTHLWDETLHSTIKNGAVYGRNYCYVSLYGLQNLDQLKTSLVQNTIAYELIEGGSIKELASDIFSGKGNAKKVGKKLASFGRKFSEPGSKLPYIQNFAQFVSPTMFHFIKDQIICFDDLERCGKDLRIRDVFGLISYLREQKNCKCFLLLNDGEIGDQLDDFNQFFEKTFDRKLVLSPAPKESVAVATIGCDRPWVDHFRNTAIALEMRNIRIVRKAIRLCTELEDLIIKQTNDERILLEAIKVLIVSSWCVFMPKEAPPSRFLTERSGRSLRRLFNQVQGRPADKETDEQRIWNERLDRIDFGNVDDLGQNLFESVENGFFDENAIGTLVAEAKRSLKSRDESKAFNSAWEIYHGSLDENEELLAEELHKAAVSVLDNIIPVNLDSTVVLLREIGRDDLADNLINNFDKRPIEEGMAEGLRRDHPMDKVTDDKLRKSYQRRAEISSSKRSVTTSVERVRDAKFDEIDIINLSKLSEEEAGKLLHGLRDSDLRFFIGNLSFFNDQSRPDRMKVFSLFVKTLDKIAKESALNKKRVRSLKKSIYGEEPE